MARISVFLGIVMFSLSLMNELLAYVPIHRVIAWGIPSAMLTFGLAAFNQLGRTYSSKILGFLGDASYSIYLTHVPAIYFFILIFDAIHLFNRFGYFLTVTLLITLTLFGGCLFYKIVEKPTLKFMRTLLAKEMHSKANKKQQASV